VPLDHETLRAKFVALVAPSLVTGDASDLFDEVRREDFTVAELTNVLRSLDSTA
jgi:hypothetical protein